MAAFDKHSGVQRGEATARFNLARGLIMTRGGHARAIELGRAACDGFRLAGGAQAVDLAAAERWLARLEATPSPPPSRPSSPTARSRPTALWPHPTRPARG